jgi:hypothetical protein
MTRKKKETDPPIKAIAPPGEVAPQHQLKEYQAGWDYVRAEAQRQQVAITKPHLYRQCSLKKLAEKINLLPNRNGLYSSVLANADLEEVIFSVPSADIERTEDIKDTNPSET